MKKGGSIYIMTNKYNKVLYTGVTEDLLARTIQHREKEYPKSFTARYNVDKLVYFENFLFIEEAIAREKQIKAGNRKRKIALVQSMNPEWKDLFEDIKNW